MLIGGFQKSSLIDFKGRIAAIVFLQGCNFICPYCHNPELVRPMTASHINFDDIMNFLKTRIGKLDGVVITGGEPTLHKDLPEYIKKIKELGFEIKLDTNGTNPDMLYTLTKENLIDYIAMDIKTSLENYQKITIKPVDIGAVRNSIDFIVNGNIEYEFRTTVVQGLLCYDDFVKINELFKSFAPKKIMGYYLQKFQASKHINENYINAKTFEDSEFERLKTLFCDTTKYIMVR